MLYDLKYSTLHKYKLPLQIKSLYPHWFPQVNEGENGLKLQQEPVFFYSFHSFAHFNMHRFWKNYISHWLKPVC